jgi:hypothetical protein
VRRLLAVAVAGAGLLAAAPAHATLVYTKNVVSTKYRASVWVANDDGSSPRRLVTGRSPNLSPDAKHVVFARPTRDYEHEDIQLRVIPTAGGTARTLLRRLNGIFSIEWSPDSRHVLALGGPRFGPHHLKLLDAATGAARTVAKGYFFGFSFSPDGERLVYSRAPQETQAISSDLYTAAVAGGAPKHIATSAPALYPVWGPQYIAYSQARLRKNVGPAYQIHRINPDGSGHAVITRTKVAPLVWGLTPTAFAADGTRLLAQFGGQDTSYAVGVDPATGAERLIGPRSETQGFVASAISKDGETVLAASGGWDESNKGDVVTVPWAGGKPTVVVRNADEPDWDR